MFATPDDVETHIGRTLTPPERDLATVLLATVLRRITTRIPIDTRIADGRLTPETVTAVQAAAVTRVLKNPDGYRTESAGEFSYTIDTRAAAGFLTILKDEWAELGASRAGFATPTTDHYRSPHTTVHPFLLAP